jgi:hypothetical protein
MNFTQLHNQYAASYNKLAEVLETAGIDVQLLHDVVTPLKALADLQAKEAYKSGYFAARADKISFVAAK